MNTTVVGSIGVGLLLVAFLANLIGWLDSHSRLYQGTNALGAAIAAYSAWAIDFIPFVVLEGTWSMVALIFLVKPDAARRARRA